MTRIHGTPFVITYLKDKMTAPHWLLICMLILTGTFLSPAKVKISHFESRQSSHSLYTTQNGTVTFSSDAPLENISAKSTKLKGVVDTTKGTFAFSVDIITFSGFNSELQRDHFNENYMESEQYPKAIFTGRIIEPVLYNVPGTYAVRAKGQLNIHGIKKERIIPCKVTVRQGSIKIVSDFTVSTSDHGIKIPRIVYDKISPDILVSVEADLKPMP